MQFILDDNFLKSLAIEMSTKMSHFVKESDRKTMLLNGATSTLKIFYRYFLDIFFNGTICTFEDG